jgi:hypothetical protein
VALERHILPRFDVATHQKVRLGLGRGVAHADAAPRLGKEGRRAARRRRRAVEAAHQHVEQRSGRLCAQQHGQRHAQVAAILARRETLRRVRHTHCPARSFDLRRRP